MTRGASWVQDSRRCRAPIYRRRRRRSGAVADSIVGVRRWLAPLLLMVGADAMGQEAIPSGAELERLGARIGGIVIERVDIFDRSNPGENHFVAVAANMLHVQTHDHVIRRELLFAPGDPYRQAIVDESARNLRRLRFVYNISITATRFVDGVVDIAVHAQDNWTTRLAVQANHLGGVTTSELEIKELNVAGFGKELELKRAKDIDRTTFQLDYTDPRLFGSRFRMRLLAADTSDGNTSLADVSRPFYALDTRWFMRALARNTTERNSYYDDGDLASTFRHRETSGEALYGWSEGLKGDLVDRFRAGFAYADHRFDDPELELGAEDPGIPIDRSLSGPVFEWERLHSRYIVRRNYERLSRDEDYNLGPAMRLRATLSLDALGASADSLYLEVAAERGYEAGESRTWLLEADASGQVGSAEPSNAVARIGVRVFDQHFEYHTLYAGFRAAAGHELEPHRQLVLGGDTGLRAFDARALDGDRLLLLTLEDRYFRGWALWHVLDIGLAGFVDVGNAFRHDESFGRLRGDVGVGLRIGLRKAATSTMVTVDVAYPFGGDDEDRTVTVSVGQADF